MIMKFQSSLSGLTLRICYQIYLLKQDPEVTQNQDFAADNLATIIPAGHDLEV